MTRIALTLFFLSVLIVVAVSLLGEPGVATLTWLGWQVNTTAAAGVLIIGLMALGATVFWRTLIWILAAPERTRKAGAETRRKQGRELLTRGFLAAGETVQRIDAELAALASGGELRRDTARRIGHEAALGVAMMAITVALVAMLLA